MDFQFQHILEYIESLQRQLRGNEEEAVEEVHLHFDACIHALNKRRAELIQVIKNHSRDRVAHLERKISCAEELFQAGVTLIACDAYGSKGVQGNFPISFSAQHTLMDAIKQHGRVDLNRFEGGEKDKTVVEKFGKRLLKEVADVDEMANQTKYDYRIPNFWVFLISLGKRELAVADIIRQTHQNHFNKEIPEVVGSDIYMELTKLVGENVRDLAMRLSKDDKIIVNWRHKHGIFQRVINAIRTSFYFFFYEPLGICEVQALEHLAYARSLESAFELKGLCGTHMESFCRIAVLRVVGIMENIFKEDKKWDYDTMLKGLEHKVPHLLSCNDPILPLVAQKLREIGSRADPSVADRFLYTAHCVTNRGTVEQVTDCKYFYKCTIAGLRCEDEENMMRDFADLCLDTSLHCGAEIEQLKQLKLLNEDNIFSRTFGSF